VKNVCVLVREQSNGQFSLRILIDHQQQHVERTARLYDSVSDAITSSRHAVKSASLRLCGKKNREVNHENKDH
jgi:hypothetical protein